MTDDLSEKLNGILSDPEAMQEIAALASQLGVTQANDSQNNSGSGGTADLQGLMGALNTSGSAQTAPQKPDNTAAGLSSILPMLGALKQEDETTRLLDAMRPFLSEERRYKLDKAKRLIKVLKLMPLIKELPLFDL